MNARIVLLNGRDQWRIRRWILRRWNVQLGTKIDFFVDARVYFARLKALGDGFERFDLCAAPNAIDGVTKNLDLRLEPKHIRDKRKLGITRLGLNENIDDVLRHSVLLIKGYG